MKMQIKDEEEKLYTHNKIFAFWEGEFENIQVAMNSLSLSLSLSENQRKVAEKPPF